MNYEMLRALGLDPGAVKPPTSYEWPDAEHSEAKGLVSHVTLAMLMAGNLATNAARIPEFQAAGIRAQSADEAPWLLRFWPAAQEGELDVRTVPGSEDATSASPDLQNSVGVDIKRAGAVIISGPHGRLLVEAGQSALLISLIEDFAIAPLASIAAPLQQWLADAQVKDSWLEAEIGQRLERGSPWAVVTAVALFAQYLEPGTGTARAEWMKMIATGLPVPALAAPRLWCRELREDQLRTIQELATAEADRVDLMLDDVTDNAEPQPGSWQSEWLDACHGRDDLEGVQLLLTEGAHGESLQARLARLDRTGSLVRKLLPSRLVPADERTRRAHRLRPEAWWATE